MAKKQKQQQTEAVQPETNTPKVLYVAYDSEGALEMFGYSIDELAANGASEGQRLGIYSLDSVGEFKNSPTIVNQRAL